MYISNCTLYLSLYNKAGLGLHYRGALNFEDGIWILGLSLLRVRMDVASESAEPRYFTYLRFQQFVYMYYEGRGLL